MGGLSARYCLRVSASIVVDMIPVFEQLSITHTNGGVSCSEVVELEQTIAWSLGETRGPSELR